MHEIVVPVKFNEVDSLGIVWHGHYIRYFEDGREAFGKKFGLGYLDIFKEGYVIPVVNVQCDFKWPLHYGDTIRVVTEYIPCEAAKIRFEYTLFNADTNKLIATGHSIQVFLDRSEFTLQLSTPLFYEQWKKENGIV